MTIGKSKFPIPLFSYLTGVHTSGGSLRDVNSGFSLEDFNRNAIMQAFTHGSFANNQYFVGTEVYYHTPNMSVFFNTK